MRIKTNNQINKCQTCNKEFLVYRNSVGKFCSKDCYWNSKKRSKDRKCIDCYKQTSAVNGVVRCFKCSSKFRSGENHPRWTGGISCRDIHSLFNPQYVGWRNSVLKRDKYKCRINNKDCDKKLQVHHILRWADYPELRYDINNGIALCLAHHPRKRAEEKRLTPYFKELVSVSK